MGRNVNLASEGEMCQRGTERSGSLRDWVSARWFAKVTVIDQDVAIQCWQRVNKQSGRLKGCGEHYSLGVLQAMVSSPPHLNS